MCSCDVERPSAFRQIHRKARVQHKCCECKSDIPRGTVYEYSSGIWEGRPYSFKTCLLCVELRDGYTINTDCCAAFRELRSDLQNMLYRDYGVEDLAVDLKVDLNNLKRLCGDDDRWLNHNITIWNKLCLL